MKNNEQRYFFYLRIISLFMPATLILLLTSADSQPGVLNNSPVDYYSAPNLIRFADYLFQQKDYESAVGEYTRFLIAYPDSPAVSVCNKLIRCYEKTDRFDNALTSLQFLPDSLLSTDCFWYRRKSKLLFQADRFGEFDNWISSRTPEMFCVDDTMMILQGAQRLKERRWKEARAFFDQADPQDRWAQEFINLANMGERVPKKSRLTAGLLAVMVPGAGKLYLGRKSDALISLLATAATAWRGYVEFDKNGVESTSGWFYGGLGLFFYGGNIYGSYVGAKIYNQRRRDIMDVKIETVIRIYLD
ncbi:MAG: hypothetical protein B6244_07630 [Candidatus Cloacimonetes bacterium 4572_55]|nr:MAG: hypothetical protein B6244_07630 [Candidatus Cloacimonetes bacterium 4572_55]